VGFHPTGVTLTALNTGLHPAPARDDQRGRNGSDGAGDIAFRWNSAVFSSSPFIDAGAACRQALRGI
jgi:hypothetical protein